jgi:hypothetical protein
MFVAALFNIGAGAVQISQATVPGLVPGTPPQVIDVREVPPPGASVVVVPGAPADQVVENEPPSTSS